MSITYKFDTEKRIVFVRRFGKILPNELENTMEEITCHADFNKVDKLLSDVTDSDLSKVSTEELTNYAEYSKDKLKHLKVAIIAPQDFTFGISRMFEMFSTLENVMVFRDNIEALEWLKLKSPLARGRL